MEPREFTSGAIGAAAGACIGMLIGPAAIVLASLSLFMVPIQHDLGLSRGQISGIEIITPLANAITSLWAGRWMDRWGVRRVVLPAVLCFAAVEAAQARIESTWELVVLFVLLGVNSALNSAVPYTKVVSQWFNRRRGLVIGIVIASSSVGSAIIPQLVRRWIEWYGWRGASTGLALLVLCVGVPLQYLLLRERPRPAKPASTDAAADESALLRGATRAEALRQRAFWIVCAVMLLSTTALVGTIAHAVPMLVERGFTPLVATDAVSMLYVGGILGQLLSGLLVDRFDTARIVLPFFVSPFLGILMLYSTTSPGLLLAGAALVGLGQGSELGLCAYLVSRYFGLRAFGQLYGLIYAGAMGGVCLGILGMGVAHDHFGSYHSTGIANTALLGASLFLVALLGPYAYTRQGAIALDRPSPTPTPPAVAKRLEVGRPGI